MTKQRVVIAGGSGLIGSACRVLLQREGYEVIILTRDRNAGHGTMYWNPDEGVAEEHVIDGAYAVINLCGLSLADGRWTAKRKQLLYSSRIIPARFLAKLIGEAQQPPVCYIGMSAIGIYGDSGEQPLSEGDGQVATGFIPSLVQAWEEAHESVACVQNVVLRTAVVMSEHGGFLEKMLPPARLGLYPYFGDGKQILSWIHIDDLADMFLFFLRNVQLTGIYHASAPGSLSYRDLMLALRKVMGGTGVSSGVPRLMMRFGLGEMSSILFESINAQPKRIRDAGFRFRYPDAMSALHAVLKK